MKKIMLFFPIAAVVFGCASNPLSLQRATATSIGGDYMPSDITVDNIDRSAMNVEWNAVTNDGKTYKCSADDMVRKPLCKEKL